MGGEKQCLKPRAMLEFTSNGKEKKRFTHKQVNAHTHTLHLSDVEECLYVGSH